MKDRIIELLKVYDARLIGITRKLDKLDPQYDLSEYSKCNAQIEIYCRVISELMEILK
jgi:hypothetical protein